MRLPPSRVRTVVVTILLAVGVSEELLVKRPELTADQRLRRQTIVPLGRSFFKFLIYFSAAIMVLEDSATEVHAYQKIYYSREASVGGIGTGAGGGCGCY